MSDPNAQPERFALTYEEMRGLALGVLRRWARRPRIGHTSLVHETYLRLAGSCDDGEENREHFLAMAARAMRFILIDEARRGSADKRSGGLQRVPLDGLAATTDSVSPLVVALSEALDELERVDPRRARIVELRVFGGLTVEETGQAIGVSPATIHREWPLAKAWLYRRVRETEP